MMLRGSLNLRKSAVFKTKIHCLCLTFGRAVQGKYTSTETRRVLGCPTQYLSAYDLYHLFVHDSNCRQNQYFHMVNLTRPSATI